MTDCTPEQAPTEIPSRVTNRDLAGSINDLGVVVVERLTELRSEMKVVQEQVATLRKDVKELEDRAFFSPERAQVLERSADREIARAAERHAILRSVKDHGAQQVWLPLTMLANASLVILLKRVGLG